MFKWKIMFNQISIIKYSKLFFSIFIQYWLKLLCKFNRSNNFKNHPIKGLLGLTTDPDGNEKCNGCKLCAAICPSNAITLETNTSIDGKKYAPYYEIDLFKCIYCGLCEAACPVDAIVHTPIQHYHFTNRGQQMLTKEKLLAIGSEYSVNSKDRYYDQINNK